MTDPEERPTKLSTVKQALLEQRLRRATTAVGARAVIPRRQNQRVVPLSFAQERLWFLDQIQPGQPTYNRPLALRLAGRLDVTALRQAVSEIVRRHDVLRTRFQVVDGQPVQTTMPAGPVNLPLIDLARLPHSERENRARALAAEISRRPIDLAQGPFFGPILFRLGRQDHVLLLVIHHIAFDGWSGLVFRQELARLYNAFLTQTPSLLPELPIQYADFADWQHDSLSTGELADLLDHWQATLHGAPPSTGLRTDHPRRPLQTFNGAGHRLEIGTDLLRQLKKLCQREQATLYMLLLAAFEVLLHRYSGQVDLVLGSPVAGRPTVETEQMIGLFVNTLVLRTDLADDPPFRTLLGRVRAIVLEALDHQELPFEKLVEHLQPERDLSRQPLFQVIFNFENLPRADARAHGLSVEEFEFDSKVAAFDLSLEIVENFEGLVCSFEYNTDLFEAASIDLMSGRFLMLLEGIINDPDQRVSALPIMAEAERHRLLVTWNDTRTDYPRYTTIHQLFEAQVEQTPNAVAVLFNDQHLTYDQLNRRANQLAHYLQRNGVGPEVCVGLCLERSPEMIVTMLAILKAGGAYVPLDPDYPMERLSFMVADTQASVLVTQQGLLAELPKLSGPALCLDRDWTTVEQHPETDPVGQATADSLAYVMYTSGSTGKPKGTCISHRNVVRLVKNTNYADLTGREVFLQFAPISFDAATFEIWAPLLNGGRLVVFPGRTASLEELAHAIERYQVTTLWLTAGLFHHMADDHLEHLKSVRHLMAGGDVLSVPHVQRVLENLDGCTLINAYGPTENTTFTTSYTMTDVKQVGPSVAIGRPIANTQVYILDRQLQPVPVGVSGELYIGGDGLARGYLNRPELTAKKFIRNPFDNEPGTRLYKTGDLARYLPNGNIEFLGRFDHQVKIRGFRVEPGEIETVLGQHPAVQKNAILAREDHTGHKRLVAYVVSNQKPSPTVSELGKFLKRTLPGYMIPATFVFVANLPLNRNGKIDRHALTQLSGEQSEPKRIVKSPKTAVEQTLAAIWSDILKTDQISCDDNFFELGGHSLLATQVISRTRDEFKVELPLQTIFEAPTVAQLADEIEAASSAGSEVYPPAITAQARDEHSLTRRSGGRSTTDLKW
jgi:aspartate racemase